MARANFLAISLTAMAVLLGLILRLLIANQDPLWLDEQHTVWSSHPSLDPDEVQLRARQGNQQPLFFQLTQWVRKGAEILTGNPDPNLVLRLPSLVSGLFLLGLACRLCYAWSGCWFATTIVAWMIAVDQEFLFYSSEARPYALLQLAAMVQVIFFWRWIEGSGIFCRRLQPESQSGIPPDIIRMTGYSLGLLLSSLLIVQLHLTGVWLFLIEGIWVICILLIPAEKNQNDLGGARKRLILFGLPIASVVGYFLMEACWQHAGVFGRKANWLLISQPKEIRNQLIAQIGWLSCLACVVGLLNFYQATPLEAGKAESRKRSFRDFGGFFSHVRELGWRFIFVCLWSTLPLLMVLICEATGLAPLALKRYALIGSAGLALGSGLIVAMVSNPTARILLSLIVTGVVLASQSWLLNACQSGQLSFRFEDWGSPISEIENSPDRIPVLLFANLIEDQGAFTDAAEEIQSYLQFPVRGIPELDPEEFTIIPCPTLDFQKIPDWIWARIRPFGASWLLIRGSPELCGAIVDRLVREIQERTAHPATAGQAVFASSNWSDVQLFRIDWKAQDDSEQAVQGR